MESFAVGNVWKFVAENPSLFPNGEEIRQKACRWGMESEFGLLSRDAVGLLFPNDVLERFLVEAEYDSEHVRIRVEALARSRKEQAARESIVRLND